MMGESGVKTAKNPTRSSWVPLSPSSCAACPRKSARSKIEFPGEKEAKEREMMDFQSWKQRSEEMIREAEKDSLANALRESRKRSRRGRTSTLAWELKRIAGRLLKLSRS